ncbi:serine hydrolase-like protein isoform X2 [Acanthopagrus latus]|uniref:serine hydrolase-like protein isoform X2 n=1 Tax=Acanthopagrus latus TaxID=8177 RepID=UPI00187CFFE0|nr:serine hydrolase-like protein isoform X2 [Acanthopagrus latus]
MSSTATELSVPVPWGQIRGKAWGPDHGRPVLCLHGWADNCGTFNTLIPRLPKDGRYVAVDMPGHGLSSHRPPGVFYSFPAYVADVRRIVDSGNIAALFSALYPDMVDAVVLLDTLGFIPTDLTEIPKVMRQGMDEMLQYEKKTEEKRRVYTYEKAAERICILQRPKNIARMSFEQSLEMQARIQAPLLAVLADEGFCVTFPDLSQQRVASRLLQGYHDRSKGQV